MSIQWTMFVVSEVVTAILPSGLTAMPSGSMPTSIWAAPCASAHRPPWWWPFSSLAMNRVRSSGREGELLRVLARGQVVAHGARIRVDHLHRVGIAGADIERAAVTGEGEPARAPSTGKVRITSSEAPSITEMVLSRSFETKISSDSPRPARRSPAGWRREEVVRLRRGSCGGSRSRGGRGGRGACISRPAIGSARALRLVRAERVEFGPVVQEALDRGGGGHGARQEQEERLPQLPVPAAEAEGPALEAADLESRRQDQGGHRGWIGAARLHRRRPPGCGRPSSRHSPPGASPGPRGGGTGLELHRRPGLDRAPPGSGGEPLRADHRPGRGGVVDEVGPERPCLVGDGNHIVFRAAGGQHEFAQGRVARGRPPAGRSATLSRSAPRTSGAALQRLGIKRVRRSRAREQQDPRPALVGEELHQASASIAREGRTCSSRGRQSAPAGAYRGLRTLRKTVSAPPAGRPEPARPRPARSGRRSVASRPGPGTRRGCPRRLRRRGCRG